MIRSLHLALLLEIASTPIFAQIGEAKNHWQVPTDSPAFQRFTDQDGLAQNTVFCLLQDSKGFLWIGTWDGVNRYDGYQFVNYKHDFQNRNSMSDNKSNSMYETKSGEIWVGTRNGLNRYNQATDDFDSYKFAAENPNAIGDSYVQTVFEDSSGTLWVGTDKIGLSKFDRSTETFTNYRNAPENPESLSDNNVFGIGEDKHGVLWIATAGGLNKFDRETGRFTRFRSDKKNPNSLSDDQIRAIFIDRSGIIWLGTQGGLNKFDPNTNQFTRFPAEKNNPRSLDDNAVRSIYETKSGTLWVGTRSGLNRYSKETDDFIVYKHDPANPQSLGEGEIQAIVEDNREQLWVGTSRGGLSKYNQKKSRFRQFQHDPDNPNSIAHDNVFSMFEDKNKILWIATRDGPKGGLFKYDSERNRFEIFKGNYDNVTVIYEDRGGKVWVGTNKGLFYFDPEMKNLIRYKHAPGDARFLNITAIQQDRAGHYWIGTRSGEVSRFDGVSGEVTPVQYYPHGSAVLSDNIVYTIFIDSLGQIWIGVRDSLNNFAPATQSFTQYKHDPNDDKSLSSNDVGAIHEDRSGTLWFGTGSGGLNRFDRQTKTFAHFSERDGLPTHNIYEILEDERGNLWMSTNKGLARFNKETNRFRNFDINDGLPYNEFNDKAGFKNQNGEMYFGGPKGFVKFNPKDFTDSDFKPPIYLTDLRIFEQPLKTEQNITEIKDLSLSWRDYVVSFDFAALDFTDPKKLQYQWKLEGFDDNWINGGTRRTATYTNLDGGEYVLKVKATNVDGVWTEESLNLKIIVTPPFYRTPWFFGLLALVVGVVAWRAYRFRIDQLRAVSEAQTRFTRQLITSQEAERKRIAAELHDGLGQSLVIIKNRALLGIGKGGDPERVARELNSISESASQALDEVRDITNNLRPQLLDRLGLTKALNAMLKKVSGVIEVKSEIDTIDGLFSEDEEISIYRIVQESVNNIVKHSNASEAVVRIDRTENRILIEIEDNGMGFDVAGAEENHAGMGLVGLKERAQLLGGEFAIDSKVGEGTKIRVVVALK